MKFYGFLLQWSLLSLGLTANPGIKLRISKEALLNGKQFGTEFLKQKLKGYTYQDWSGLEDFKLITFNCTLSGLTVHDVEFPQTALYVMPENGVYVAFDGITATISGAWKMSSWLMSYSSRVNFNISKMHFSTVVTVSQDETGHLSLLLKNCETNVSNLYIQLDGISGWLFKPVVFFLKHYTRNRLEEELCLYIKEEVQRINMELREHLALVQVDPFVQIDLSLTGLPTFNKTYIDLDVKGIVYPAGNVTEPPFTPATFMLPDNYDSMLHIGVSEYVLQSALLAYYSSGAFNISLGKEHYSSFKFTTDTFSEIIPMFAKIFSEPYRVMFNLVPTAAPDITLLPGQFLLQYAGSMDVLVALPHSSTQFLLLTLNITAITHAKLTIFKQKLVSELYLDSFHLSLVHSKIGFFKVSLLEDFLTYILQYGIIPVANVFLKNGFPLPNLGKITLVKTTLRVNQGYLLFSTDYKLK